MTTTDLINQAITKWANDTNCGETDESFQGEINEDIDLLIKGLSVEEAELLLSDEPMLAVAEEGVAVE